jgi:hypothetical protein
MTPSTDDDKYHRLLERSIYVFLVVLGSMIVGITLLAGLILLKTLTTTCPPVLEILA